MKKILFTLSILFALSFSAFSQTVPQGMKYQAVARDASGKVLSNQDVKLKITLYSNQDKTVQYSEIHNNTTNELGLFALTIGQGEVAKGSFADIPWSTDNIWMSISIAEDGGDDFLTISDSELLAVPYAYHAATAGELAGMDENNDGSNNFGPIVPEDLKRWLVGGNAIPPLEETNLDPSPHTLGTTTMHDLIFIVNDQPAMFLDYETGKLEILGDATIDNDLKVSGNIRTDGKLTASELEVEKDVNLNTLGGETNINGPTEIRNTLDVDAAVELNRESGGTLINGPTTIRNTLDVDESTHLNRNGGSTLIDGPTTIRNTLDVDESTHLNREGGSTLIDGPTTIRNTLDVDESTHLNREGGSTLIDGPTTIRNTLDVDESTHLNREGGSTLIDGPTTIRNTLDVDESTHLNREGGSTLVDGPTTIRNTLDVDESTQLNREGGTTTIFGITTVRNVTQSTDPTNGALNVDGGVGIEKNLNVAEDTKMDGTLLVRTEGSSGAFGNHVAQFENLDAGNGICIKVGSPQPTNDHNFITFKNRAGATVGRVEGESTPADLLANPYYQRDLRFFDQDIDLADDGVDLAEEEELLADLQVALSAAEVAVALAEIAVETAESGIPPLTAIAGLKTALNLANGVLQGANIAMTVQLESVADDNLALAEDTKDLLEAQKQDYIDTHNLFLGVTYSSGAGDYAEYLPKLNAKDDYQPGEVVGMKNGKISKNTVDADRVMVISLKPAVLGNMPNTNDEYKFEKVAFLGKVHTKTIGKVEKGDYILPSGFHNGCAIAKNPSEMSISDYKKIIGVAWGEAKTEGINFVNVAVGLNANDFAAVIQQQQEELNALKSQINETNDILADLVPGFKEAAGLDTPVDAVVSTDEEQVYIPEDSEYEALLEMAKQVAIQKGKDVENHPFWSKYEHDSDYKKEVIETLKMKYAVATLSGK